MKQKLKPAVRMDGGKRIDLKARREGRGVIVNPPTRKPVDPEQIKRQRQASRRAAKHLIAIDGGKDGAETSTVRVRDVQGTRARTLTQTVRCRPGTFEWRYGRNRQDALFHAGSHFAQLWERAGIAVASSADFLRGTTSGYPTTISDGRVVAMEKVGAAVREIGRYSADRLIAYCVLGETTAALARKHSQPDRDMAAVLHQDLRAVAMHFRFL